MRATILWARFDTILSCLRAGNDSVAGMQRIEFPWLLDITQANEPGGWCKLITMAMTNPMLGTPCYLDFSNWVTKAIDLAVSAIALPRTIIPKDN